jgi:hypothetical protein
VHRNPIFKISVPKWIRANHIGPGCINQGLGIARFLDRIFYVVATNYEYGIGDLPNASVLLSSKPRDTVAADVPRRYDPDHLGKTACQS